MRFIRAAEELRMGSMRKCVEAYPHSGILANAHDPHTRLGIGLDKVRQHALELSRKTVVDELQQLHAQGPHLDELQRTMRRHNIQTRLKRLVPGTTTALKAMRSSDGVVTTEPCEMAATLRDHWGSTFAARQIDEKRLLTWLREVFPEGGSGRTVPGLPKPASTDWQVTREDVEKAIKTSTDSMPGPDGIPYLAWRALGQFSIDRLFDVAQALATDDGPRLMQAAHGKNGSDHEFNLGILCCVPKKLAGADPTAGEYYSADSTRPLSIVNTDNRLIANA